MYDWNDSTDATRFVQTYADLILRLSLSYGLSRQDAQDICQELFLKLLSTHQTFSGAEHEKAWVIRATGNACKNLKRAAHWSRRADLDEAQSLVSPSASTQDHDLLELVRSLPEKYRLVISLYYYEGYSAEEIAQLLHQSPAAIRKRLERARKQMKIELKGVIL